MSEQIDLSESRFCMTTQDSNSNVYCSLYLGDSDKTSWVELQRKFDLVRDYLLLLIRADKYNRSQTNIKGEM